MELKKDLLIKEKKSTFRIILGILFLIFAIIWIYVRILDNQVIRVYDWLFTSVFALNGVMNIIEGLGLSIERLFGKAFVLIDNEQITLKPGITGKEQNIYWKEVKAIYYKSNKIQVEKLDNTNETLDLSKLSFTLKNEIKDVLTQIAKNKNIQAEI